ncbi:hypothetical protein [Acinetobacter sp. HY1485]|uniref:hypothetical protein n=1 Tax=Acinetobacter sp. HY1485 TaxID=2970918 RepID=UPI0022B9C682|nr:hypothetical protein [Acinetobacter sp. HY1485]
MTLIKTELKETVIICKELEFLDKSGNRVAKLNLEENLAKRTGIVELEIGWYEGRAAYCNLNQPFDQFLKTESLKHLIFKAFNVQIERKVKSGEDFILWIYKTGLQDIKKARKENRINAFDLRWAYDELKEINGADDTPFFMFAREDLARALIKIYGDDYNEFLYPSIKDVRYEFLENTLKNVQLAL